LSVKSVTAFTATSYFALKAVILAGASAISRLRELSSPF